MAPRRAVPGQRLAVLVAGEQPVIGAAGIAHHQPGGVGVAAEEFEVDLVGAQQLMHQRQDEQPIGAGADADPFVGDGGIAGADRVDRDELRAARLHLGQARS